MMAPIPMCPPHGQINRSIRIAVKPLFINLFANAQVEFNPVEQQFDANAVPDMI